MSILYLDETPICGLVRIKRQHNQLVQWCDIYIGRTCFRGGWQLSASKWQNKFTIAKEGSVEQACIKYYYHIKNSSLISEIEELRGKILGCWCDVPDKSLEEIINNPNCHGEVLMRLLVENTIN